MAQPFLRALRVAADGRYLGELHLRIHPTNNAFVVATSHETTALHLVQLRVVVPQKSIYPAAACIAPPPAASRSTQSTREVQTGPRTSVERATDTTSATAPNVSAIGAGTSMMHLPCIPSCILWGASASRALDHVRREMLPPNDKAHRFIGQFLTKEDFRPLPSTNSSPSTWSSGVPKMNSTTSQDSEMKALREEVNEFRAALSTPPLPPPSRHPFLPPYPTSLLRKKAA
ncbi:hypothetical protein HPB50_021206 [Hyalomma asiaticum]|uniref:Uncharacterized protein n=1 Tax=Hyalomma asiaticum TaxID=266040 RepID=A0ACB7RYE8_HYAAI|nr:hypothetical protein HPB50_021206 [Hyalomma asiaticum]